MNDILELKYKICDHLLDHQKDNISFSICTHATFKEEVLKLKQPGARDTQLSDLIPMVIANLVDQPVIFYCARANVKNCTNPF